MANLRVDRKDDSDIGPPLGYFQTMGIIAAVVVVVVLVINGLCTWSTWYDNNHAVPAANAKIEEFNNLPLESRRAIIEWNQIEDFEPETYLRPLQEKQRLSFWLADYPDAFAFWAIILTSVITFLLYCICCSEKVLSVRHSADLVRPNVVCHHVCVLAVFTDQLGAHAH